MNHKEIVAREGWIFIAFALFITAVLYMLVSYIGLVIGLILTIFCIYFFRNPERSFAGTEDGIVSPADGKVMDIMTVYEDNYIHANTIRIRIFLNIFNVHVNRSPWAGRVEWVNRVSGLYLPAYRDEVSDKNARNYLGLSTSRGKILVVQITGLIARRLVCWVKPGDELHKGERFGLIRFGSCTEVYLPEEVNILVKPGQILKGGETEIARFCK
ncbi:MAG: phosphatidylserine decarboxylase family protein [Syntrophomonas sp.]|nr:phosphatidylserine decarboxylase family protein [Syntrophomonas sp.]